MILFLLLLFLLLLPLYARKKSNLPPGPRGLPLIGNLHQIPAKQPWRRFRAWHKRYGPLVSIRFGQRQMIILGNYRIAQAFLDRRSKTYSSRPELFSQLGGGTPHTLFLPTGPRWRAHRRIHASFLASRQTTRYRPLQDVESRQVLAELLTSNDFAARFHRYSASLAFSLAYGRRIARGDEPEVQAIERIVRELFQAVNPVLAAFPLLSALPAWLAPWRRAAARLHDAQQQLFLALGATAMETPSWNWTLAASRTREAQAMSAAERAWVTGITFEAASDTTTLSLEFVIRACVLYPEAVRQVQEEISSILRGDDLPGWEDLDRLPRLDAFLLEVYRMFPTSPAFGAFHAAQEDDVYEGYSIPRGTAVVTNNHSLGFDEETFGDPWSFRPDRWLQDPTLPMSNFGYGRRICPGQHLAHSSIRLITARLLWGFDISGVPGQSTDPHDITDGLLARPTPFEARFSPRSPQHKTRIEMAWQEAEKDVDVILRQIGSSQPDGILGVRSVTE
ncbi:hypothetical protein ASPZODRAFT_152888 [Penicilliopsis zonata CBS 506.65]|uniref:Cytochrome P450 n=1 Tax=Penicilliopsis zonata CBS 506.65 TaxID=1073090 RepID=A0A1L9SFG8_9EURO|nr:hypothetical protein ASPZODRAFT_152888 [Penicilliopsis zonata CBS 506.65]OJJ45941.1 hypothetical protein ASPZODRAFT_152888 [Penicilliopsis zonata CBS 506.65]